MIENGRSIAVLLTLLLFPQGAGAQFATSETRTDNPRPGPGSQHRVDVPGSTQNLREPVAAVGQPLNGPPSLLATVGNGLPKPTLGGAQFWSDVHILHE